MQQYHLHNRPNREIILKEEISEVLKNGKFAVISMCRDNEPYIVTLSYGYDSEKGSLYFHTSSNGLKLDFLQINPLVCATVIEDGGYIMDECGHAYKSVVFWGDMKIVTELEEKKHGMGILLNHLEESSSIIEKKMLKLDGYYSKLEVLRLDIRQIHGKAGQ